MFELFSLAGRVEKVAAGRNHTLVLKENGSVWSAGGNYDGQTGAGWNPKYETLTQVSGLGGISDISAGDDHSIALGNNGYVYIWGNNYYGQLGNGHYGYGNYNVVPMPVWYPFSGAYSVEAAGYKSFVYTQAGIYAFGDASFGQLGGGLNDIFQTYPVLLPNPILQIGSNAYNLSKITAGYAHCIGLSDDKALSWGANWSGMLGDGSTIARANPVIISGSSSIIDVASGNYHSLAIDSGNNLWAWGSNWAGQLGIGTATNATLPTLVNSIYSFTEVSAGHDFTLVLKNDGTVAAFGSNTYGQLGLGDTVDRLTPVTIPGLNNIVQISAGGNHAVALDIFGNIWAWGCNQFGQLGLPSSEYLYSDTPVLIAEETTDTAIYWRPSEGPLQLSRSAVNSNSGYHTIKYTVVPEESVIANLEISGEDIHYHLNIENIKSLAYGHIMGTPSSDLFKAMADSRYTINIQLHTIGDFSFELTLSAVEALLDSEIALDLVNNETCMFTIRADNVSSFTNKTYKLTYNHRSLQLLDFAAQTLQPVTTVGAVSGTSLTIISHRNGELIFTVNKAIPGGFTWSGTLTVLRFKALATGVTFVRVV
jgi:alpha-tubulin suppressor-like RCC1 family protein